MSSGKSYYVFLIHNTYQSQYNQRISNHRQHKNNSIQRYLNPPGFVPLWYTRRTTPPGRCGHQRSVLLANIQEHRGVPIELHSRAAAAAQKLRMQCLKVAMNKLCYAQVRNGGEFCVFFKG